MLGRSDPLAKRLDDLATDTRISRLTVRRPRRSWALSTTTSSPAGPQPDGGGDGVKIPIALFRAAHRATRTPPSGVLT